MNLVCGFFVITEITECSGILQNICPVISPAWSLISFNHSIIHTGLAALKSKLKLGILHSPDLLGSGRLKISSWLLCCPDECINHTLSFFQLQIAYCNEQIKEPECIFQFLEKTFYKETWRLYFSCSCKEFQTVKFTLSEERGVTEGRIKII